MLGPHITSIRRREKGNWNVQVLNGGTSIQSAKCDLVLSDEAIKTGGNKSLLSSTATISLCQCVSASVQEKNGCVDGGLIASRSTRAYSTDSVRPDYY
jgi:hypothetical protein